MNSNIEAKILTATDENIKLCAEYLVKGGIVGMPTETVYGLAANAFDIVAVKNIFEYKGRPLSDPLIVHVDSIEMAKKMIKIDEETNRIFDLLSNKYWPGPMTLVLKANFDILSPILTANTEYIGVRMPRNQVALKLISLAGVPIAAPSANKFCHVSPVNPHHVFDDFKEFPVYILDDGVCNYCMESTVIKITNKKLQILRMGALSPDEFSRFLKENKIEFEVEVIKKIIQLEDIDQEAPGQFIKHYSPKIDTYILDEEEGLEVQYEPNCIVLDYKSTIYNKYKDIWTYIDLSTSGNIEEVMHNVYDYLRKAENIEGTAKILLCDLGKHMEDNPHKLTLLDRVMKAASHRRIKIKF
jgi:tRNA threonylcarbamoyl adenosine modification protein (Sua5/YciO/YrdC/YwlC family)